MEMKEGRRSQPYPGYHAPIRGGPRLPGDWPEVEELRAEIRSLCSELDAHTRDWNYWLPLFHTLYDWLREMGRWFRRS